WRGFRNERSENMNFWKGHSGSVSVLLISLYISNFDLSASATPISVHLQLLLGICYSFFLNLCFVGREFHGC
ncbi:hypothetical protein VIGAN_04353400, partial [Vigna angularis var. angularis]